MHDDNDGQTDATEIARGADPLDATSSCISTSTLKCDIYELTEVSAGVYEAAGFSGNVIVGTVGTVGADVLEGTSGADLIVGRRGADSINRKGGDDAICGGPEETP